MSYVIADYAVARKKFKKAEDLSDLSSGTDNVEYLKKSRRIRAAKIIEQTTSNDEELSDDNFISDFPNIPDVNTKEHLMSTHIAKKPKITKDAQHGKSKNY